MVSLKQGKELVNLARQSIKAYFSKKKLKISPTIKRDFSGLNGVFVTLNKHGNLRGCIGFPDPIYPLYEGVVKASQSAAFSDPRFPPMEESELNDITMEVSVLTRPSVIEVRNPEDYIKNIRIGKDGLIIRGTFSSGLLLPQVAVEYKWDAKTFLDQTCVKAGLPPETWHDFDSCRVYKFQSQVFSEKSPSGEVVQLI